MTVEEHRVRVAPDVSLRVLVHRPRRPPRRPAFLLVHGLASNARLWSGVAEALASAGHEAVAVDQRGHGASDRDPGGRYELGTLTDDLRAVSAALGLGRPVVAGQSWGGNVVLELGRRAPSEVAGVVGVDGGTIDLAARFPDWERCREALAPPALAGTPRDEVDRAVRERHPGWPETAIAAQLANLVLRADGTVEPRLRREDHLTILRGLWEHRPERFLRDVRVPVLLLPVAGDGGDAGLEAKRAGVARAEELLADVRVRWFEDRDHDVHAQDPAAVAEELLRSAAAWCPEAEVVR